MGDFEKIKLKNGITVLLEHRKLPIVSVMAAVKYGSAYENEKLKGIAHFLEHLVFKGTKKRNQKQIAETIEGHGGEINAATAEEFTFFYTKLPSKHARIGAEIISDIMLNPLLKKEDLEQERKVIMEEINLYHDRPELYVTDKIKGMMYEHPFGLSPLGSRKSVMSISRNDLLKMHSFYNPKQMILSIVGKIKEEDILPLLEKQFRSKIKSKPLSPIIKQKSKFSNMLEDRKGLEQAHVCFGFGMPPLSSKKRYSANIFNSILGVGMSSWLWQDIREKRGLAYTISSNLDQGKNYGYCFVYGGVRKGHANETLDLIKKAISRFQNLSKRDFEDAKERLIGNFELANERSDRTSLSLIQEEAVKDAKEHYLYPERISKVKLSEIKEIARIKNHAFVVLS